MANTSQTNSCQIFEKSEHTWIIDTFTKVSNKYRTGYCQGSSIFPENERKYKWMLHFYPNGFEKPEDVSLYLHPSSLFQCFAKYTFILKNSADETIIMEQSKYSFNENNARSCGSRELVSRKNIISSLRKDGILKIQVVVKAEVLTLQSYHEVSFGIQESQSSTLKLSHDLEMMFNSNKFSDFVLKFNDDGEIPVHRFMLAARSSVFSAMFEYDTSENKDGYTKITDIDKDTMLILLNFIYTGNIKNLSVEKLIKLTFAADKYQLEDLKGRCINTLGNNLNISNALEVLICAEKLRVPELKVKTMEFIFGNFKNFSDTKIFLELAQKYPLLVTELLIFSQKVAQKS